MPDEQGKNIKTKAKIKRQNAIEMNILRALENTLLALNWFEFEFNMLNGPLLLGINLVDVHSAFIVKWHLLSADVQQCTLRNACKYMNCWSKHEKKNQFINVCLSQILNRRKRRNQTEAKK